jgi:hypothetical protein
MSRDRVLPPPYSLVQCIERLPAHAQEKYEALRAALDDAEALQRSLMERVKAAEDRLARISRRYEYSHDSDLVAELDAARGSLERLDRERSRRNSVRGNTEQIVSRLNNFIMQRSSGAADIAPPPKLTSVPAGRRKGESIVDALTRVRREIAAAEGELRRIKSAPPPALEVKLAIIEEVDALAKEGRPLVTSDGGRITINWPDVMQYATPGSALSAPSGSASKMLAWLFRKELIKKLIAEVEDNEGGIPARERPQRIREAEARIFGLETAEGKLVCQALDAGLEVHRRPDASPWAILGFGVVEEAVPASPGFGCCARGRLLREWRK